MLLADLNCMKNSLVKNFEQFGIMYPANFLPLVVFFLNSRNLLLGQIFSNFSEFKFSIK